MEIFEGDIVRKYPLYAVDDILDLKALTDRCVRLYASENAFKMMTGRTGYHNITYGQFGDELRALANALIDRGFSGLRIILIGENAYSWILSYFAIVNANATVVPLDKELTKEEILSLVRRSGASAIFYSGTFEDEVSFVASHIPGIDTVSLNEKGGAKTTVAELIAQGKELVRQGKDKYSDIEIDRDRTCTILFTSGTTGVSKGVMLSHRCLAADTISACKVIKFTTDDVLLSVLPINHAYEALSGIIGPIYYGVSVAFCKSIKDIPACLKLFRPTVMVLVPLFVETFYKRIWETAKKQGKEKKLRFGVALGNLLSALGINARDRLLAEVRGVFGGRLKTVICGGAYLNPELVKAFRGFGVQILQGYGITECSPIISVNRVESHKDASVGWVFSCCDVRFDEAGQILVKGDNVMKGYLDDPESTAEAFDGEWFKTGDLGYRDKDGFLYVTGRCKNLIVLKNGKNIMPDEVEYLLNKSPLIAESLVKEAPGDANGSESLMAVIYPDPGMTKDMDEAELRQAVQAEVDQANQKLVYYKKIHQFTLRTSEFPKTTTQKIMRYKVGNGE